MSCAQPGCWRLLQGRRWCCAVAWGAILAGGAVTQRSAVADTATWTTPALDTWSYVNSFASGGRITLPSFTGGLSINSGTNDFNPLTAASPARLGTAVVAFNTSANGATPIAGLPTSRYQVNSATLTMTLEAGGSGTLRYADQHQTRTDFLADFQAGNLAAPRPFELFGVGFRAGYTGFGLADRKSVV